MKSTGAALATFGVVGLIIWYGFDFSLEAVSFLFDEDGVVEWMTAICYFCAAAIFMYACGQVGFRNVWFWGFALLFFAAAGEEISWGQRIFAVETPQALAAMNVQGEMNLHNIDGIHQHVRLLGLLIVAFVCFFVPATDRFVATARRCYRWLGFPVFPLWAVFLPLAALWLMIFARLGPTTNLFLLDEFGEVLLAIGFLAYALVTALETLRGRRRLATLDTGLGVPPE